MFQYDKKNYNLIKREAKIGELVKLNVCVSKEYPFDSVMKVMKKIEKINEVVVYPPWYEESMECFGVMAFLESDDYEVLELIKRE